jgi:general secretion pathway protein K
MPSLKNSDGFALILTLLIVSLILVLTLQFSKSVRCALYSSANLKDGVRVGYMARSGFNCALALISEDAASTEYDSLLELWANAKKLSPYSTGMFDNGRFELEISDLSGRIQLNKLVDNNGEFNPEQKALLGRFLSLEPFGLDDNSVENLLDAVKDWIDPDDAVTRFGAESGYYQSLDPPYVCKNGPMTSIGELLLVKGVTRELFYGTRERPGISSYLTVHGEGKININTAPLLVLESLSDDMDASEAEEMGEYRKDEDNDLEDPGWYRNVPGMGRIPIASSLMTTKSDYFEIRSTGISGTLKKEILGIVKRDKTSVTILSWKIG